MASGMFFQYDASSHAVVNLLVLRAALVLPLAIVPLFQLQKQSATTVLPRAWNSAHLRPDLYSKGGCARQLVSSCHRLKLLRHRGYAHKKSEAAKL